MTRSDAPHIRCHAASDKRCYSFDIHCLENRPTVQNLSLPSSKRFLTLQRQSFRVTTMDHMLEWAIGLFVVGCVGGFAFASISIAGGPGVALLRVACWATRKYRFDGETEQWLDYIDSIYAQCLDRDLPGLPKGTRLLSSAEIRFKLASSNYEERQWAMEHLNHWKWLISESRNEAS
jgi:hypothetical protein